MFQKALMFLFAAKMALMTCNFEARNIDAQKRKQKVAIEGKLDVSVNESSGLTFSPWSKNLLSINDSGGKPELYEIDETGKLITTYPVPNAKNIDWEELTCDAYGNVYIGDFGNNRSLRKNLTIYKFNGQVTQTIRFQFEDQEDNPKNEYDCEAFFWYKHQLYLITKSWESGVKKSRLYQIPDQEGDYRIRPIDEINLKAQITGASINPSQNQFALISYGKILIFGIENETINFSNPLYCIKIAKKQTEAILYTSDSTLVFTNEQRGIYKIEI